MSPGTPGRAWPRWGLAAPIPPNGAFTFAERPDLAVPEARILWRAELDPGALPVEAVPAIASDPDAIDPAALARWLTRVVDPDGVEHVVLSDGWHRIRLDLLGGSLGGLTPVVLQYRLRGVASLVAKVLPLRRLLHLFRYRRFSASLFPEDRRIARWLELLRVHDAVMDGASQCEIACALFGAERVACEWSGRSDSLRSRTRRLIREARRTAAGGYRSLLGASLD